MPNDEPVCIFCPKRPLLVRKGYYNVYQPDALYGLIPLAVPLTHDRSQHPEAFPTPVQVYVCMSCGFVALFSEDVERDWKATGEITANMLDRELREGQPGSG